MARTDTLPHFLTDVADAIREKKGTTETIQASDFDTEIANLPSGGGDIDEYLNLEPITITSNGTNPWWQTSLALEKIANVEITIPSSTTSIAYLFYNCKWSYIPKISKFENNLKNTRAMFYNCSNLTKINAENINMISVTNANEMFRGCFNLKEINFGNQIASSFANIEQMFNGCSSLQRLNVRGFDFTTASSFTYAFNLVPATCEIIVKDQTQKDWFATNFSNLTNVKTVAEYEGS